MAHAEPVRSKRQSQTKAARREQPVLGVKVDTKRRHMNHLQSCNKLATSQGQASRFLCFQTPVFTFLITLYTVLWIRQSSKDGSTSTAKCLPEKAGASFVIRTLADAFVSRRDFVLSQYLPAGSATKAFKLLLKLSKGSSQVTTVWGNAKVFSSKNLHHQTCGCPQYCKGATISSVVIYSLRIS